MNELTSKYELDLIVKSDMAHDAIRNLDNDLKRIGETAKKSINNSDFSQGLKEAEKVANEMIGKLKAYARDETVDFNSIAEAYAKKSQKAIGELESQYAKLRDEQIKAEKELNDLTDEYEKQKHIHELLVNSGKDDLEGTQKLMILNERIKNNKNNELKLQIEQNRQLRARLKSAETEARIEKATQRIKELEAKRETARDRKAKKALDEQIKQQKALLKAVEQTERAQKANSKAIQEVTIKTSKFVKLWNGLKDVSQVGANIVNITGAIRSRVGAAGQRMMGYAKTAGGIGLGVAGMAAGVVSQVSGAADQEVEREQLANRVKGLDNKEADRLLREIYIQTGADYSTIVDAINRVQATLGTNIQQGELQQATELELRYPGMSIAFASQTGGNYPGMAGYQQYGAKLNAIQKLTGASSDQIAASTQAFANRKDIKAAGGSVSDYQAVYLAMQNSGAFETEDELEEVFKRFVQKQSTSGKDVFEFAKSFKMADYAKGDRNKIQARNADQNMDWEQFWKKLRETEGQENGPSDAEKMSIKMRELEDKKNQLLMRLIPAALPLVEALADLLEKGGAAEIVEGLANFLTAVVPLLEPVVKLLSTVLKWLNDNIMPILADVLGKAAEFLGKWVGEAVDAISGTTPQNANGGFAFMPSIVGERGPEAIIPLDFSRAQRASNIATNITQTFNMGTSQTTALSLAQAVKTRDFSRAMTENSFITKRCGAF